MELSVKDYASLTNQSIRHVQRKISDGELKAKVGIVNQQEAYLIDASQLPPDVYRKLLKKQRQEELEAIAEAVNWLEIREKFGVEAEDAILQRHKWVREAIRYESEEGTEKKKLALAERIGVSKAKLYRWVQAYKTEGIIGLIPKPIRKHLEAKEVTKQFRSMDEAAVNFVKALYLEHEETFQPKVAWVYRQLLDAAKEYGWKIGSRATCYRVIEEIAPTEKTYAREGLEAWQRKMLHKIRREFKSLLVNEVWNGDTHDLDFFIEVDGKPIRPQLIAWQDVRSRGIVGYVITLQGNGYRIGKAMKNGILKFGLPQIAYSDRGKDYDSKYLEMFYERLGIQKTLCLPRWPNSKPIERFFETLTNNYTRFWPGYCGSDAKKNRPPGFDEKKLCEQGKLVTLEEAIKLIDEAIDDYNNTIHSELGCTPMEVLLNNEPARPGKVDERTLDFALTKEGERKVQQDGVHFRNHEYWCEELHPLRDKYVTIYYDPDDISQLIIYHEGKPVGVAENKRLRFLGATEEDLNEHLRSLKREKKRVEERIRSYRENTLEGAIEKRLRRGPSLLEGKTTNKPDSDNNKVTLLTGHERQAREVDKQRKTARAKQKIEDNELATKSLHDSAAIALSRIKKAQGGR